MSRLWTFRWYAAPNFIARVRIQPVGSTPSSPSNFAVDLLFFAVNPFNELQRVYLYRGHAISKGTIAFMPLKDIILAAQKMRML